MKTVTVTTKECPGSLLLAGERDGGARACGDGDGGGLCSPKTLPILLPALGVVLGGIAGLG